MEADLARASVDFFVCLLYGSLLVAMLAFVSLGAHHERYLILLATAAVIIALRPLWYWRAVVATDKPGNWPHAL